MARIEINYYGTYKNVTGKSYEVMDLEDATLGQLIDRLREKYGEKLDEVVWDPQKESLKGGISVLINGRSLPLDTTLKSSDQVAFLMPMAGG
jgi:MoaD family protein